MNISQLIMSDQMNNYKRAMVRHYKEGDRSKAGISLYPYSPVNPIVGYSSADPHVPYPLIGPAGVAVPTLEISTVGMGQPNPIVPWLI